MSAVLDYAAIFRAVRDPYLVLSPDLIIVAVNDTYLSATMTRQDILGCHMFTVFPDNPEDPLADGVRNLSASLNDVLHHRVPHAMPLQKYDIRRRDGNFEERYWEPLNAPVFGEDDRVALILHHVTDVTGRVLCGDPGQLTAVDTDAGGAEWAKKLEHYAVDGEWRLHQARDSLARSQASIQFSNEIITSSHAVLARSYNALSRTRLKLV